MDNADRTLERAAAAIRAAHGFHEVLSVLAPANSPHPAHRFTVVVRVLTRLRTSRRRARPRCRARATDARPRRRGARRLRFVARRTPTTSALSSSSSSPGSPPLIATDGSSTLSPPPPVATTRCALTSSPHAVAFPVGFGSPRPQPGAPCRTRPVFASMWRRVPRTLDCALREVASSRSTPSSGRRRAVRAPRSTVRGTAPGPGGVRAPRYRLRLGTGPSLVATTSSTSSPRASPSSPQTSPASTRSCSAASSPRTSGAAATTRPRLVRAAARDAGRRPSPARASASRRWRSSSASRGGPRHRALPDALMEARCTGRCSSGCASGVCS